MFSSNTSQVSDDKLFVEDCFSCFLYTANNTTQTITNGIDLAGKGGLIWFKTRNTGGAGATHTLVDSARGNNGIFSSLTSAQSALSGGSGTITLNSNGFTINGGVFSAQGNINNGTTDTLASWTFRKAPKFFDVVTFTTNSSGGATLNHLLGIAPGMVVMKATGTTSEWSVYHRSLTAGYGLALNTTAAQTNLGLSYTSTASTFVIPDGMFAGNTTYVAYLFAHDTTSDGIIQCGSYTGTGAAGNFVSLGWEPQWVLIKRASGGTGDWRIIDNMRGLVTNTTNGDATLNANTSEAEFNDASVGNYPFAAANPTGFTLEATSGPSNASGSTYIYIAIRRGPMRTPTTGTSVFSPDFFGGGTVYYNSGFPTDLALTATRAGDTYNTSVADRLRGQNNTLVTSSTAAQLADTANYFDNMVGYGLPYTGGTSTANIGWLFRRAPGFFDEVCYTGTGSATTVAHNLGVAPELTIFKSRSGSAAWYVLYDANSSNAKYATLNTTGAGATATYGSGNAWSGQPTATTLSLGSFGDINGSGSTYVAYLFASCPGVSKVGSYTGNGGSAGTNGTSQNIDCGFSSGARFILIKRTSGSGDWCVFDSARGIVSGNDPCLQLNATRAEQATDAIDPLSSGFTVNQEDGWDLNVTGSTYIYLAIS